MARITMIITSRYLPLLWGDDQSKSLEGYDALFDTDIAREIRENFNYIKTNNFNNYDVFVVPCLRGRVTTEKPDVYLKKKGEYLEKILSLCCPNGEFGNVYLFAHDKDFCVDGDVYGDFVKKDNIPCKGCDQLMDLVDRRHAYMFAHEVNNSAVAKILNKLNDNNEFSEKECADLIDIIDAEREMNDFFTSVDSNINNTYPKVL